MIPIIYVDANLKVKKSKKLFFKKFTKNPKMSKNVQNIQKFTHGFMPSKKMCRGFMPFEICVASQWDQLRRQHSCRYHRRWESARPRSWDSASSVKKTHTHQFSRRYSFPCSDPDPRPSGSRRDPPLKLSATPRVACYEQLQLFSPIKP